MSYGLYAYYYQNKESIENIRNEITCGQLSYYRSLPNITLFQTDTRELLQYKSTFLEYKIYWNAGLIEFIYPDGSSSTARFENEAQCIEKIRDEREQRIGVRVHSWSGLK